ncbi:MAG: DUF58 domain-containing protein [Alphaproteobacteria bacterium]|nr:DUF58 domain-containing protein [Alphaproteobacteria bacterium]
MPQAPLNQLKAEAASLAGQLGTLSTRARAASAANVGSAGRRRSGTGENFWQYRRHAAEDGADRIDWRRSAREENLFVRETELETARTFLFWVDPSPGFGWSSDPKRIDKADRALTIAMALAGALSRSGERAGALGGGRSAVSGAKASARVGEDIREMSADAPFPSPPRDVAAVVIASDFYQPLETWRSRLTPLAGKCRDGALLQVCDPIEETYPFDGRVRFFRPGEERQRLIGRAESIRDGYLERFARRRSDMIELAAGLGWRFVSHATGEEARTPLGQLAYGFADGAAA